MAECASDGESPAGHMGGGGSSDDSECELTAAEVLERLELVRTGSAENRSCGYWINLLDGMLLHDVDTANAKAFVIRIKNYSHETREKL